MLKVGLTGGIGSGKSTVAKLFKHLYDIPVIDADIIAHQIVKPGQPALSAIKNIFGQSILTQKGELNRAELREIIFSDQRKKKQLEDILHPLIYQEMQDECDRQTATYSILCIPLLLETKMTHFVDHILVIDCPLEIQIERVQQRDSLSKERIISIISSQVSRKVRLSQANSVIHNTNSLSPLAEQVKKLHNQYLLLSNS